VAKECAAVRTAFKVPNSPLSGVWDLGFGISGVGLGFGVWGSGAWDKNSGLGVVEGLDLSWRHVLFDFWVRSDAP
jgi:hypothetical protein